MREGGGGRGILEGERGQAHGAGGGEVEGVRTLAALPPDVRAGLCTCNAGG